MSVVALQAKGWLVRRRDATPSKRLPIPPQASLRAENFFCNDADESDDYVYFLLGSGGVVHIPRRLTATDLRPAIHRIQEKHPLPLAAEQAISAAGTFWVSASNGVDLRRKIHFQGFCQSAETLSECVEDVVLGRGGAVVHQTHEKGLEQKLRMTVAVPYLFGVPPELETLKTAIELGGGLLHRVYGQWYFY